MSVYVIRELQAGDLAPTLVGIYVAESAIDLARQADGDCARRACEYAVVPHISMYGPEAAAQLYVEADGRGSDALSDDWRELFSDGKPLQWSSLDGPRRQLAEDRRAALARSASILFAA